MAHGGPKCKNSRARTPHNLHLLAREYQSLRSAAAVRPAVAAVRVRFVEWTAEGRLCMRLMWVSDRTSADEKPGANCRSQMTAIGGTEDAIEIVGTRSRQDLRICSRILQTPRPAV